MRSDGHELNEWRRMDGRPCEEEQRWDNHLFVFDSRLAMTPGGRPAAEAGEAAATLTCHCCEEPRAPPPHRNCPNVDCNRLFLVCPGCLSKMGGFCCAECGQGWSIRSTPLPSFVSFA